jgi:hypothetical protein
MCPPRSFVWGVDQMCYLVCTHLSVFQPATGHVRFCEPPGPEDKFHKRDYPYSGS